MAKSYVISVQRTEDYEEKYTVLSAQYCNPDHTGLIAITKEAAAVFFGKSENPIFFKKIVEKFDVKSFEIKITWEEVRFKRNTLLKNSDWTQLPDAPVDKDAWSNYRQALRDITQWDDPNQVVWPEEPTNK